MNVVLFKYITCAQPDIEKSHINVIKKEMISKIPKEYGKREKKWCIVMPDGTFLKNDMNYDIDYVQQRGHRCIELGQYYFELSVI